MRDSYGSPYTRPSAHGLARAILRWALPLLGNPRVIYDREGVSKYLSRYYIVGAPTMPDGSDPFDSYGDPRPGAIWPKGPFGLYLHHFHRSDDDVELHNHPWRWALSLILFGGYSEERRIGNMVVRRVIRPGDINFISETDFHRVDLLEDDAWSLFLVGPKFSSWGFWNRYTGKFTPWREFVNDLRDSTSFAREAVA